LVLKLTKMKNNLILFGLILCIIPAISKAQAKDYKVVFDMTSKDSNDQKSVIRWIDEITGSNPNAQLEVVLYSQGVDLAVNGKSAVASELSRILPAHKARVKICAIAMKNHHLEKKDLLPGVEIVPDGIYEIISKQRAGWGYIKATH
jgi:intracellular sulfur oxidation DsrE/DsrF family protein